MSATPVVRKGRLVGIVTESELLRISPSPATSLSVFELNYLLSQLRVKDAMTKDVVTVSPDTTVEEAAILMRDNAVSGLPVLENDNLIGIITETNIFDAFVELMGIRRAGTRLTVSVVDRPGVIAALSSIIRDLGVNIISMATFFPTEEESHIVIRLSTKEPEPVVEALTAAGYDVVNVRILN